MGCKCDSNMEELEIKNSDNIQEINLNEDFQTIFKEDSIKNNNFKYNKSMTLNPDLKDILIKKKDLFQTISEKNETINIDENTAKKNTIEIYQKEDEDSFEENNIDKTQRPTNLANIFLPKLIY